MSIIRGKPNEKYIPISIAIGSAVLLILIVIASLAFTFNKGYIVHYSEKSNIDYKVYLKPNDNFIEPYLGMNKRYIASLIDNIDTTFDYSFKSDEDLGIKYTYYVVAKLEVNDAHDKNLYEKEDIILKKREVKSASNNTFDIKQHVVVDYDKYNKIASDFINEYKLTATAKLIVSLIVDIDGKHSDFEKSLSDMEVISLSVPLTEKTVDIEMDYDLVNSADQVLEQKSTILKNRTLLFIVSVLAVTDINIIIGIIYWVVVNRDAKTKYQKRLNKVLKDYNRYISETVANEKIEDLMKTKSLRIVVIKNFEDMLDIRDSLNKPILYHEEIPGEEAVFYIITEGIGYIYDMKLEDIKNERKK
jgi:hypothetical protein